MVFGKVVGEMILIIDGEIGVFVVCVFFKIEVFVLDNYVFYIS